MSTPSALSFDDTEGSRDFCTYSSTELWIQLEGTRRLFEIGVYPDGDGGTGSVDPEVLAIAIAELAIPGVPADS